MRRMKGRFLAIAMAFAMGVTVVPQMAGTSVVEAASYSPRYSAPSTDSPYYNDSSYNPFCYDYDNCLPNCTCYAWGRAYELMGSYPNLCRRNAVNWYSYNADNGIYSYGQTPRVGSIVVWGGDQYGHVGVVESVDGGTVVVSQSAYDSWKSTASGNYFYTTTFYGVSSAADMGYQGSVWRDCLGFIYLPIPVDPDPVPWSLANLDSSFTAQIRHDSHGWLVKDSGGSLVCQSADASDQSTWWEFTKNANGTYRIRNCKTGKYIDDYGAGTSNGTAINPWDGNGTAAQNWYIRNAGNGKVLFESECATGMTMDMGGDPVPNGLDVHLWVWSSDNANQWYSLVYDRQKPVITNVKVSDVTPNGYKVTCDVSDDVGIKRVAMPTWTTKNGQDDLATVWPEATVSNGHASYYVSAADHKNEYGVYITDIYAYDYNGKYICVSTGEVEVPDPSHEHTWDAGVVTKAATCTEAGERTCTCTICKKTKTDTIAATGHKFDAGTVTKEVTRFENGVRTFTCTNDGCGETKTELIPSDSIHWVSDLRLSDTNLTMEQGKSAGISVETDPVDAVKTDIIWQSSDEDVATVTVDSDGNATVTAVGIGEATITASAADSFPPTTEYRSRTIKDYETKTTTVKGSLGEAWEYVSKKTDTVYGAYGPYSEWSRTAPNPGASDTREVETRTVPVYTTQYDYDKWAQYSDGTGWSGPWEGYWSGIYCGKYTRRGWSETKLNVYKTDGDILFYGRSGDTWYGEYTRQQQTSSYTEYRYRDRTKTVTTTYTYRKPVWSDWSEWSASPVEKANNVEVETRDVTGAGQAAVSASCKVTVNPIRLVGWNEIDGNWYYYTKEGVKLTGFQKIDRAYYIFDKDGIRQSGWYTDSTNGNTYYMNEDGVVQRGVTKVKSGADGSEKYFYFDNVGIKMDGFVTINGKTYYYDTVNGRLTGKQKIGTKWYLFSSKGVMQTGWVEKSNGTKLYYNEDGTRAKGKLVIDGSTYYFGTNGVMVTGWLEKSGKTYYFNADGTMQFGWRKINKKYYFFNGKGAMVTGWLQRKGNWYYLQDDGTLLTNGTLTVGPKTYIFDKDGILVNP